MSADENLYQWDAPAEAPKTVFAPKMKKGKHKVRIAAIKHASKDGVTLTTKDGDPQCIFVFANKAGEEAAQYATLVVDADKSWAIRAILKSITPKINFEKMAKDKVTPATFADPAFATKVLMGRELAVEIDYSPRKGNKPDGTPHDPWTNITYLASGTVVEEAPAAVEVPDEEIPF